MRTNQENGNESDKIQKKNNIINLYYLFSLFLFYSAPIIVLIIFMYTKDNKPFFALPYQYINKTESVTAQDIEISILFIGTILNIIDFATYILLYVKFHKNILNNNSREIYKFIKNNIYLIYLIILFIFQIIYIFCGNFMHKYEYNMYAYTYYTFCHAKLIIYEFYIIIFFATWRVFTNLT